MRTVLMVAEKPSLAQSIAGLLSNGHCSSRHVSKSCSMHEWNGKFLNENVRFKMTSVCGHVMSLDFPGKYNNWDKVDPAELFDCPTQKKEANPDLAIPKMLSNEGRDIDFLVLWLDCDKEGENICFEVTDIVRPVMKNPNMQNIYRAHFSAVTESEVNRAMNNLIRPNQLEAASVDARQELDLRIGCAFTRFQTTYFHGKYGGLDSATISYGPCQTPTLGFCVDRHDRIQSFKPESYWILEMSVRTPSGGVLKMNWKRERVFNKDVAQMFLARVKAETQAKVISMKEEQQSKGRPHALNTVDLLKVASSSLGLGPQYTMQIAERLYTQGYISYPRTETTKYPDSFDLNSALKEQLASKDWGLVVDRLLKNGYQRPKSGKDAGDHPPITPMRYPDSGALSGDYWRLYEYIARYFVATLCGDMRYMQRTAHLTCGSEEFTCSGRVTIDPGFTAAMPWMAPGANESLPQLAPDQMLEIEGAPHLSEHMTAPPDYLTESDLISLMEQHGIGTDASISVHINNICERNYVALISPGRRLKPTPLGIALVHGYQRIDVELVLPTMRSALEKQLSLIAVGQAEFAAVLAHGLTIFKQKFRYFVELISAVDELFEVTFSPLAQSGRQLSRCGKCRRYLRLIAGKAARLYCSNCDDTYKLPSGGSFHLYRELKCPLDDFELLLYTSPSRTLSICPYCYNNPPFPDEMHRGQACNQCAHPTCPYSPATNAVGACSSCEVGKLVLDPPNPPKWRLSCTECSMRIDLFEGASRVSVSGGGDVDARQKCSTCKCAKVTVEYKSAEKSPLPDSAVEYTGCVFCDKVLQPLAKIVMRSGDGEERSRGSGRGHRRGGRGRGGSSRRGSGRGR